VYAVIALSCIVENFFPPSPSDIFVALAAFVSQRGQYDPLTIFLSAWIPGVLGAVGVYLLFRRWTGAFQRTWLGRHLATPEALAGVARRYGRYGMPAMFVVRLLPAFRAVVAPFAGLYRLPPARALLPITLASGVWYASLTLIGMKVGAEWETIRRVLDRVDNWLLGAAIGLVVLVGLVLWQRQRRKGRA